MKRILLFIFMFVLAAQLFLPAIGLAQGSYKVLEEIPGVSSGGVVAAGQDSLRNFLNNAFKLGITIAILLSVIMVVIGGIQYMGSESPFDLGSAKEKWTNVAWGLLLALGIYLLLNTINPDLVSLRLSVGPIGAPPGAAPVAPVTGACPVQPLAPITDSLTQQMESGTTVIWEGTDPNLQRAASCLIRFSNQGRVTSAYRPQSYQAHLYQVREKWCTEGLRSNADAACSAVRSAVSAEVLKHFGPNWSCGVVAQTNSTHGAGTGVDISGLTTAEIRASAERSCLSWANYASDPWHFNLIPACTPICNR